MRAKERIEMRMEDRRTKLEVLIARGEDVTAADRAEMDQILSGLKDDRIELRAAIEAEPDIAIASDKPAVGKPEDLDRAELRKACSIGGFLAGIGRGRLAGPEAELQQEMGLESNMIPLELWEPERRQAEPEKRTVSTLGASQQQGVNLDTLRPAVFAPSVVDRLSVDMPRVESGVFATGTLTTLSTADAVAKGADVPETGSSFTVSTTQAHRIGGSINIAAEDVANAGAGSFEPVLREHVPLMLSDELDDQMLNGAGADNDLEGFFHQLTFATDAISAVAGFDDYVAAFADAIEGLWATEMSQVAILAGVDSYRLSAKTFRDVAATDLGSISFADYAKAHTAGWATNKRMPAVASNVQNGIICRKGRSMMPNPTRLAVCPHWGYLSVDDIYSQALKGQRRYVVSVLVGDVIIVQPAAFGPVRFKVS